MPLGESAADTAGTRARRPRRATSQQAVREDLVLNTVSSFPVD
jgi:hypothetical protein